MRRLVYLVLLALALLSPRPRPASACGACLCNEPENLRVVFPSFGRELPINAAFFLAGEA